MDSGFSWMLRCFVLHFLILRSNCLFSNQLGTVVENRGLPYCAYGINYVRADKRDCTKYFYCENGEAIPFQCRRTYVYNYCQQKCEPISLKCSQRLQCFCTANRKCIIQVLSAFDPFQPGSDRLITSANGFSSPTFPSSSVHRDGFHPLLSGVSDGTWNRLSMNIDGQDKNHLSLSYSSSLQRRMTDGFFLPCIQPCPYFEQSTALKAGISAPEFGDHAYQPWITSQGALPHLWNHSSGKPSDHKLPENSLTFQSYWNAGPWYSSAGTAFNFLFSGLLPSHNCPDCVTHSSHAATSQATTSPLEITTSRSSQQPTTKMTTSTTFSTTASTGSTKSTVATTESHRSSTSITENPTTTIVETSTTTPLSTLLHTSTPVLTTSTTLATDGGTNASEITVQTTPTAKATNASTPSTTSFSESLVTPSMRSS